MTSNLQCLAIIAGSHVAILAITACMWAIANGGVA